MVGEPSISSEWQELHRPRQAKTFSRNTASRVRALQSPGSTNSGFTSLPVAHEGWASLPARVIEARAGLAAARAKLDPLQKPVVLLLDHLLRDELATRGCARDPLQDLALFRTCEVHQALFGQAGHGLTGVPAAEQGEVDSRQVTFVAALGSILGEQGLDAALVDLPETPPACTCVAPPGACSSRCPGAARRESTCGCEIPW